jgi:hypothetical protein
MPVNCMWRLIRCDRDPFTMATVPYIHDLVADGASREVASARDICETIKKHLPRHCSPHLNAAAFSTVRETLLRRGHGHLRDERVRVWHDIVKILTLEMVEGCDAASTFEADYRVACLVLAEYTDDLVSQLQPMPRLRQFVLEQS